jgi:MFS family permease
MPANRWVDKTQPQTLYIATIVMYINAVLGLITGRFLVGLGVGLILVLGPVAAGWGIANEKKWGYWLGVVLTALTVVLLVVSFSLGGIITLLFYVALLALLLHPQSREYRKTWFT